MKRRSISVTLLVAGAFLFFACNDVPTASSPDAGTAELTGPQLAKKGGKPNFGPAIMVTFTDRADDNIRSDGRGIYVDRECGVSATFNLEDARLDPDANKINRKEGDACGFRDGRFVAVSFNAEDLAVNSPERPELLGLKQANFFKVNEVELVTGVVERTAVVHGAGCAHGLKFNSDESTAEFTVNNVEVTQIDLTTWEVHSVAPHVAVCIPDEDQGSPPPRTYWHMSFEITAKLK